MKNVFLVLLSAALIIFVFLVLINNPSNNSNNTNLTNNGNNSNIQTIFNEPPPPQPSQLPPPLVRQTIYPSRTGSETNGQAISRGRKFIDEWDELVEISEILTGESRIRLNNYMMGFAEGAYELCEYYGNAGYRDLAQYGREFFKCLQQGIAMVSNGNNYRNYYYATGYRRTKWGESRLGINDFR